jgi:competence protein ComEC
MIIGFEAPIVRASLMAGIFLIGRLLQRQTDPLNVISAAALIILFINPQQLFQASFQLSFMAVIAIVFLYQRLKFLFDKSVLFRKLSEHSIGDFLGKLFLISLSAQLGTLPLVAYYFHRFSIISFLMNLLVIPLLGIIIALGLLSLFFSLFSISLAQFYANTNTMILDSLVRILEKFGQFKFSAIEISQAGLASILLYYFLLLLVVNLDKKICRKALIFSTLIIFLLCAWQPILDNDKWMKVIFFDVGQGDAALVTFPDGKNLLIDSGPCFENFDAGKTFIIPYLKREKIRRLDAVVLTHSDVDHIGGMASIFRNIPVNKIYDNGIYQASAVCSTYRQIIDSLGLPLEKINAGHRLTESEHWGLFVLHPTRSFPGAKNANFNNSSIVLKISNGKISFLFTGDIEVESETFLLNYGNLLQANVLKIPHHGSQTSSSLEFLQCVAPEYAIISVGKNNKFNFPNSEVLERLNSLGIKTIRTDVNGAVVFRTDGTRLERIR